jgi:cellulose synthase/poly-beta-1,6-N-acetylglucosamine synthase-like glycosyltransferase
MIIEWVFWAAVVLVAHSYVIYPALMVLIGRHAGRPSQPSSEKSPSVAVVLAAFNEEGHIEARIRNVAELDHAGAKVVLYIGSDGSTDATATVASRHSGESVRVLAFVERRGKASVLNELLAAVDEDIVVFTDANTKFEHGALKALVAHFDDPAVGAVSGELRLAGSGGDNQDAAYWRVETAIKLGEASVGGLLGANGGIYAIRRELYRPLPPDTIVDDFTVVMNVSALGWRTVFEPAAIAFEDTPPGIDDEFRRRVRIGIGNYQAFFRYPEYWLRATWTRRFTYLSHKVIRWFTPHLLIVAFVASLMLAPDAPYALLLAVQVFVYGLLGLGMFLRRFVLLPKVISIPLFVFALNVAFIVAFWRYVTKDFSGAWRTTQRARSTMKSESP